MDHRTLHELTAGAALGDLDDAERRTLDRHAPGCRPCLRLASELDDVLADLALAAPARRPPPALHGLVLAGIRGTAAGGAAVVRAPAAAGPRRRSVAAHWRTVGLAGMGLAAVLAVAVAGLGVRTMELVDALAERDAALAAARSEVAARQAVLAVAADPGHVTTALAADAVAPGASAVVIYRPGSDGSFLVADGLPATPDGMVYQLWHADAAGVHPLGTFRHDGSGQLVAPFGVDLSKSAAAMVTLEPVGGARGEPGPQVVFGEL